MKLLIFTQKVDRDDSNLGFFHIWLSEFAKNCESVKVICLYKGKSGLPPNVEVFSLGKERGFLGPILLFNLFKFLYKTRGSYDLVFVHMNPIYLVLCGWYFKLKKIPVYLWYVHRSVDLKLKIAIFFVEKIFTSAKESFGIDTDKVIYVGHGIDMDRLPNTLHAYNKDILNIAHVGRVTKIKNIETLINTVFLLKEKGIKFNLYLYGDCVTKQDIEYKNGLEAIIDEKGIKNSVFFEGGVLYQDLPKKLLNSHITVNMTPPGGMDKAVLESIVLGIPAFASNTAFSKVFDEYGSLFLYKYGDSVDLAQKIYNFIHTPNSQLILATLNNRVRNNFSLSKLVNKMLQIMESDLSK
jgi:glycosyltransferase involved in cell wall biosynthesis